MPKWTWGDYQGLTKEFLHKIADVKAEAKRLKDEAFTIDEVIETFKVKHAEVELRIGLLTNEIRKWKRKPTFVINKLLRFESKDSII